MSQHVPAWKKVGLKLKYAKDTADDATGQQQPSSDQVSTIGASENAGKRSRDEDGEAQDGHVKKRRTDSKAKASPQHASSNVTSTTGTVPSNSLNGSADYEGSTPSRTKSSPLPAQQATVDNTKSVDSSNGEIANKENSKHNRNPKETRNRKKSVTFTPETKEEDGESISAYFKAWSAEQQQPDTPPRPSTEIPAESPFSQSVTQVQNEKPDAGSTPKPKEKKVKQKPAEKPSAKAASAYLQYLDQFHNDKSNWKFNKSKQNDLLKNIWNIFRIPPSYNEALISYISGLQGLGARQRLVSSAEDILKSASLKTGGLPSAEEMDDPEARKKAYDLVVQRRTEQLQAAGGQLNDHDEQKLEEMRQEEESLKRAASAVRALLIPLLYPDWKPPPPPELPQQPATAASTGKYVKFDKEPSASANGTTSKPAPKRSRKARTNVESSSESSNTSSSESDSDSDSDSEAKGGAAKDDDDSSEDDSSSEEDSDSSDDDASEGKKTTTTAASSNSAPERAGFFGNILDQAFPPRKPKQR